MKQAINKFETQIEILLRIVRDLKAAEVQSLEDSDLTMVNTNKEK